MTVTLRLVPRFEKFPGELMTQSVDFDAVMAAGESISSASATAVQKDTGTDVTGSVISGSATFAGTLVTYRVTGGTAGSNYVLTVRATLNTGDIYEQRLEMSVVSYP